MSGKKSKESHVLDFSESAEGFVDIRGRKGHKLDQDAYLHVTSYAWISIDPPCSSDARLSVEDAKLIKTEDLFQPASHSNARLTSPNNQDRVIGIAVGIIAIFLSDGLPIGWTLTKELGHLEGLKVEDRRAEDGIVEVCGTGAVATVPTYIKTTASSTLRLRWTR